MKRFFLAIFLNILFYNISYAGTCKDNLYLEAKYFEGKFIAILNSTTDKTIKVTKIKLFSHTDIVLLEKNYQKIIKPYSQNTIEIKHNFTSASIKKWSISCRVVPGKTKEQEKAYEETQKKWLENKERAEKKLAEEKRKVEEERKRKAEEEKRKAEEEKKNKETYLKNKTYEVILDSYGRRKGVFKEEKVLGNNVVLGKWTTTESEIPMTYAGSFYGSAFYDGGVLHPLQYLMCKNEELFYSKYNLKRGPIYKNLKLNKSCDPLKIQLIDYENYLEEERKKARNKKITFSIVIVLIISLVIYLAMARRKKDVIEYNKKYNKSFKTYDDLQKHLDKLRSQKEEKERKEEERKALLEEKRLEKERKKEEAKKQEEEKRLEKERLQEEQGLAKEEKAAASEPSGGSLTSNIARLKRLYKNGTLTKAEFEKAKNNLLK